MIEFSYEGLRLIFFIVYIIGVPMAYAATKNERIRHLPELRFTGVEERCCILNSLLSWFAVFLIFTTAFMDKETAFFTFRIPDEAKKRWKRE